MHLNKAKPWILIITSIYLLFSPLFLTEIHQQDSHPTANPSSETKTSAPPIPSVPYIGTYIDPDTKLEVYQREDNQLDLIYNPKTGQFDQYAPPPSHTFTRAESQCSLQPKNEIDLTGTPTTWAIPEIGPQVRTGYTQTNFELPSYKDPQGRYGTWKSDTAPLMATEGAGIYAGHVNNPDGSKSAWGYLHNVRPCMSKYITDENGAQREYQATEVRLIKNPADLENPNSEYWKLTGPNVIYDFTCAGPHGVGDDGQKTLGGSLLGSFPYRIVVVWDPVVEQGL